MKRVRSGVPTYNTLGKSDGPEEGKDLIILPVTSHPPDPGHEEWVAFVFIGSAYSAFTIDELLDEIGFGWPQFRIGFMAGFAWVSDGMEIMVLSILGPTLEYDWYITPMQQAHLTTMVFLGFFLGSPAFGYISDNYGRRTSLILSSAWTLFYAVASAAAPNYYWMMVLRMLLGVGVGGGVQINAYFSEFVPQKHRGKWNALCIFFWATGGMFSVATALWLMQYGWRVWLLFSAVPALIFLVFSAFLPESPRYDLASGKEEQAWQTLEKLAIGNGRQMPKGRLTHSEVRAKGDLSQLFIPKFRRTSILQLCIWLFDGFVLYGIVLCATTLIRIGDTCSNGSGVSSIGSIECHAEQLALTRDNYIELLWTTSADLLCFPILVIISDTLGRKWGSLTTMAVSCITSFMLCICMQKLPMIVLLFIARAAANSSFEMNVIYTVELYPTEVRSSASGCGNAMARIGAMLTPYFGQVLLSTSLYWGLSVYGVAAFLTCIAIYLLPVDTTGRPMTENPAE